MASEAERIFQRFAVFGESSSSGTEMNNKNFSKLCKDCGIMDNKTVTSTDVDIVFSKVKAKNARTITFQQFQEAMKELGQKQFKGKSPDEALENIYRLMEGKDPATTGVTAFPSPGHHTLSNSRRTLHLIGQKTSMTWPPPCLQLHLHLCLLPPLVPTPPLAHVISSTQHAAVSSRSHPRQFR
ncbi:tubulin polymerization-promoting protein family member 2 isoform X1 [Physeter macrocephalus]|uniref:Tubulin polymerization-promoting protein family member 2 isoform X1 n=1 Tax=Physeter macrocephalus TaxID=9755 RepID=A0A455B063_PHYMC|nr:tubulin polymerization-promoting protein family member 2 isoform X1 [Physeter catodon]|eukprot:XP_028341503.1 tubulin polymerization-promoting protein family member 2 isoform X1 [Physeter catodon]